MSLQSIPAQQRNSKAPQKRLQVIQDSIISTEV